MKQNQRSRVQRGKLLAAGEHRVLEMVARGAVLEKSMTALLRLVERDMPGMLCSLLLLDADGKHVRDCAGPSLPRAWRRAIDGEAIGPRAGSCGTAAYRRKPVIVSDIRTDPLWADYRPVAEKFGLRACWSTPILDSRRQVLGTFAIYLRRPGRPTLRHRKLIRMATHIAAIAIERRRSDRERGAAQLEREQLTRNLRERIKELTVLHEAARMLQGNPPPDRALLEQFALLLPRGMQFPEYCAARVRFDAIEGQSPRWRETPWRMSAQCTDADGRAGSIEVVYLEAPPGHANDPFLAEERVLLQSLVDMLAAHMRRARAESALQESEERYRLVSRATDHAIWDWDLASDALWWSEGVTRLFGYGPANVRPDILWWVERVHAEDRERVHDSILATTGGSGSVWTGEYRFLRADGSIADIYDRGYVMRDAGGKAVRMIGAMQDISARRQAELRIRRLNRTYEVLSGINSAIVREHDRERLLREACRIAVEHGQFAIALIAELEPAGQRLTPHAWAGTITPELVQMLGHSIGPDAPVGRGTTGRALRERRPVYCNDIGAELEAGVGRRELYALGIRSLISIPLIVGTRVTGALLLYTREQDFFDDDEIKLLAELAADISFALDYIEKEQRLHQLAFHEPLTGLPNRQALQARLGRAVEEAGRARQSLALLLINLDRFRDINDSLGHQNGDLLLRQVADILRRVLWDSDQVASLGGDEFAVLLPRLADKADIDLVLRKIEAALQQPVPIAGITVNVEATLGIALYPDHGGTPELLWQHADVALRTAKTRHEQHLFYNPAIDHYDPQRLALIGELRDAIELNQLLLHYQPKIELGSGHCVGVEALVRWLHPVNGPIPPDRFVPLAEQTGLINPLTQWVVQNAIAQGRSLERDGLPLEISVNISARNLHDTDFCRRLINQIAAADFPLDRLILEITESAIMHDPVRARAALDEMRAAGIRLSMDDFGIGHSSLAYLKDLPLAQMKIDRSFVIDFANPRNAAIVRSAIELAHNLELEVTAEGVEDESTWQALRDAGCDRAQGYFFSRPLPVAQLLPWLCDSPWKFLRN